MLSPSTVTVRRPSSTADLILSRTDSLLVRDARCIKSPGDPPTDYHQHTHLLPIGGGTHSAPLSASPSACWIGAPTASGGSRSSTPSPEARKRYWRRQLIKLKEEMDRFGDGFRRSVRGSIDTLATRLSPSTRGHGDGGGGVSEQLVGNGINIEIVRETRRQRTKSADRSRTNVRREESYSGGQDTSGRIYDYKLPSTLLLTGLRDGAFSGEIAFDAASPAQSVTIQIRDYRLEFYVPGEHSITAEYHLQFYVPASELHCAGAEQPARSQFVGAVSLPIYVDPHSLVFRLNSSDVDAGGVHRLLVDGRMKGCSADLTTMATRRLSVSATDLRLPKSRRSVRRTQSRHK